MRSVAEAHLIGDKMEEAVTHYINTHQPNEHVHIDTDGMPMAVQDDGSRITVMHQQTYSTQLCRQVSMNEPVGDGPWNEELLDPEERIAALVAHLAQNSRTHPPHPHSIHKVPVRNDVDNTVILDSSIRYNGQTLDQQSVPMVGLPPMQTLPPLQEMKRCSGAETDWFSDKNKKNESQLGHLTDSDGPVLELASGSPAHCRQQSRKSLPHKKRISRKLKRNTTCTPQQDLVINCSSPVQVVAAAPEEEQILPDNYVTVQQQSHHISHQVRPIFICQICGEFYGEEQVKFYHHLKQHYEPHNTIIIDNPVSDLVMDKMTNTCIVDNVATLPDSIVELSLENTVPKTMYQTMEKHILYSSSDKTLTYNSNKSQYSMAGIVKETVPLEAEKSDLYETLDKLEIYNCGKCTKTFRKQKHCEAHMREAHSNTKLEDMGEFSEPEDLMAGIHVCVGEYEPALLPHLTVDNGHVHQDHTRHWYSRNGASGHDPCTGCATCHADYEREQAHAHGHEPPSHAQVHPHHISEAQHASHSHHVTHVEHAHETQPLKVLKEEVLQRIFESEVVTETQHTYSDNIIQEHEPTEHGNRHEHSQEHGHSQHDHEIRHDGANQHGHEHEDRIQHSHNSQHGHENQIHDRHEDGSQDQQKHAVCEIKINNVKCHGKRKRLECGECGRVFAHRNSLTYHTLSHAARQFPCPHCPKTFLTNAALKIHKRVHNGDKPYKCDLCGRDFRQWSDLKYHKNSLHSDEKHHKCEFCGKEFARKYSLNVHRRIHTGERNYKCDFCSKTFSASSYRLTHMRTHTGDRPYKCEQCEKCFRSSFDLRRHLNVHDKLRIRFDEPKPTKPKDKKNKIESNYKPGPPKTKKAVSPTRPPILKKSPKKKSPANKKGAPNVTVQNRDGHFKVNEYPDEFNRPQTKFKVYHDSDFKYKDPSDNGFAVLKPLKQYRENTDGKMQVYTHIEKGKDYGSIVTNSQVLGDIRHLEREVAREVRTDMNGGEVMENGFLERLTALYNVPA